MTPTLERVRQIFADNKVTCHIEGDGEALFLSVDLTHLTITFFWRVSDDGTSLSLHAWVPVCIPSARRPAVAEFLDRLTEILNLVYFGLDFNDGRVYVRMDEQVGETPLTDKQVANRLGRMCKYVDGFFPALMLVAYGNMNPQSAMEQGEADYLALPGGQTGRMQDNDKTDTNDE